MRCPTALERQESALHTCFQSGPYIPMTNISTLCCTVDTSCHMTTLLNQPKRYENELYFWRYHTLTVLLLSCSLGMMIVFSCFQDPRMMAFFDSLVQRELENWSSSDDDSLDVASAGVFGSQIYSASSRSPSPDFSHSSSPDALTPFEISAS